MASEKQKTSARRNIKKAQKKWSSMSSRQRALAQPQGRARKKPGTGGKATYYRIVVRPKSEFSSFRSHDVGRKGHVIRLAGKRKSGTWDTHAWLIGKEDAKISGNTLVGTSASVKKVLSQLRTKPRRVRGFIFEAKSRKNIPEKSKPTPSMKRAQTRNIKKAQAARWKKK
jgi:hypothetical protein